MEDGTYGVTGPWVTQAGGHSLPAGEGVVGRQCVDLDALLCAHDVDRADGSSSGRDVGDVAGLAERAVQRVLHDGHRMQGDNLRGLAQPLLDVAAADKLGDRVDKGHMAVQPGLVEMMSAPPSETSLMILE